MMNGVPSHNRQSALRFWMGSGSPLRAGIVAREWSALLAVIYCRALYLPPAVVVRRPYPADHGVVAGLRPLRLRLHRQRAVFTVLRTLVVAAIVALALLLLRTRGANLALPLVPLVASGTIMALGLFSILFQRPSHAQMAHALDTRLGLHEQLGSALEIDRDGSRLTAALHDRAEKALRETNHDFVLPWPSIGRERVTLITLALIIVPCAFIAANAPIARPLATAAATGYVGKRGTPHHVTRPSLRPIKLHALGSASQARIFGGSHLQHGGVSAHPAGGLPVGTAHGAGTKGIGLRVANGRSQGQGRVNGGGSRNGTSSGASGVNGQALHSGALHLSSGKNSAAGGVLSPAQQALMNLQNSISSANGAQGQQGSQAGSPGSSSQIGNQGQPGAGQGSGQNQSGHGRQGAGQRGAPGQRGHGVDSSQQPGAGQAGRSGPGGRGIQPGGPGGDPEGRGALGRRSSGGTGAEQAGGGQNNSSGQGARLGGSGAITLNGANGQNGHMVIAVGLPNRGLGANSGSVYGASSMPSVTVPGYVAPDSNTIAPDERGIIQGYFSPTNN